MTVEEVGNLHSVSRDDLHRQLELVSATRGPGTLHLECFAELDQIGLEVGALSGLCTDPAFGQHTKGELSHWQVRSTGSTWRRAHPFTLISTHSKDQGLCNAAQVETRQPAVSTGQRNT